MMRARNQRGQANVTAVFALIGLVVAAVWAWKRTPLEVQDRVIEQALPLALVGLGVVTLLWVAVGKIRRRRRTRRERDRLIGMFQQAAGTQQRLDLAFALVELNGYRREGLEPVAAPMTELFTSTLKTALGDKQHRMRGMAASHLGALRAKESVPLLLLALEDDHAYVRASAALALGRMRAAEAKQKLTYVMQEDWDQTVRSRAREALERLD
ncbi:MAG: HEAT repeat domain-containing protein [Nitrospira sp.]|nr:HEAT repeat domain-containing protein [Nitrospira sp.]